jgi:phage tail-like protein
MATVSSADLAGYQPSAFYFKVVFGATLTSTDTSFQDVTGISSEIETEQLVEGGENRFVHKLPKGVRHPNLELKRGIADMDSPLVVWCMSVFEMDFIEPIVPQPVAVYLMNEDQEPIRAWMFENAYPVKWDVESFNSTKNEVAIEKIVLSYSYSNRLL